jgi:hypothetical protein
MAEPTGAWPLLADRVIWRKTWLVTCLLSLPPDMPSVNLGAHATVLRTDRHVMNGLVYFQNLII